MTHPQEMPCPKCGELHPFTPRSDTQHFGSIRCPEHGFRWIPKPTDDTKPRRRTNKHLIPALPADRRDFCWFCLRSADHLATLQPVVVLQVHHTVEVEHDGTDEPCNLVLLCAECHAEVHRRREAFARYV